jgi:signal transduction histidine kinase
MIGFAEVILAERFGSIGNERYREYLKDIHGAGTHLVSVLNDLVDLSKVESGQLELNFVEFDLNELTQQCVGIMQPQANRARIIIRSALTPGLAHVVADERSVRQIVLNLLAHAIRFTDPGGQVIVSTAGGNGGEGVLRVRDTGTGMRETEEAAAIQPLRNSAAAAGWDTNGGSPGLALTKALAEANRADVSVKSAADAGTLIEIAFPSNRMAVR